MQFEREQREVCWVKFCRSIRRKRKLKEMLELCFYDIYNIYSIYFYISKHFKLWSTFVLFLHSFSLSFIFLKVRLYLIDLSLPWSFFLLGILCFHSYLASPVSTTSDLLFKQTSTLVCSCSKTMRVSDPRLKLTTQS